SLYERKENRKERQASQKPEQRRITLKLRKIWPQKERQGNQHGYVEHIPKHERLDVRQVTEWSKEQSFDGRMGIRQRTAANRDLGRKLLLHHELDALIVELSVNIGVSQNGLHVLAGFGEWD